MELLLKTIRGESRPQIFKKESNMHDWEIEAVRKAYADSSVDEVRDAWERSAKHPKAVEQTALLKTLLEEKMALEKEQQESASAWSAAITVPERKKPLTPAERKAKELARLKRITRNGTQIPFAAPPPLYRNQQEYDQMHKKSIPAPRSPFSCPDCRPNTPAPSCTGACLSDPIFFQRRVMSVQEWNAFLAKAEKPTQQD
jgi:hypothetical protein